MVWKGEMLHTYGDVMRAMAAVESQEEAAEFMDLYRAENPSADENIGYMTGYFSREEKHRLQELFDVEHPIFGRSDPTPEQAFKAGVTIGMEGLPGPLSDDKWAKGLR